MAAASVIPCEKCNGAMELIEDEPMGRLYFCTRCCAEKVLHFDKSAAGMDGVPKAGGNDG